MKIENINESKVVNKIETTNKSEVINRDKYLKVYTSAIDICTFLLTFVLHVFVEEKEKCFGNSDIISNI